MCGSAVGVCGSEWEYVGVMWECVGVSGSAGLHFKQMWWARDLVFGQFLSLAL